MSSEETEIKTNDLKETEVDDMMGEALQEVFISGVLGGVAYTKFKKLPDELTEEETVIVNEISNELLKLAESNHAKVTSELSEEGPPIVAVG